MSVSKEFMDTVATGNELRTRIILSNYMVVDPSFREFEESLAYALKSMPMSIGAIQINLIVNYSHIY